MNKLSTKEYKELKRQVGEEKMAQIERDSGYTDMQLHKKVEKSKQKQNNKQREKATEVIVSRQKDTVELESNTHNIIKLHQSIVDMLSKSLLAAIEIGKLLFEQKGIIKHGEFTNWVSANLPFTLRTAQRYMKLYQYKEALNAKGVTSITEAYHQVFSEPISDAIIAVDDSIIMPGSYLRITDYANLDEIELPKPRQTGRQEKFILRNDFIDEVVRGDCFSFQNAEECYSKIIIGLCKNEPTLKRLGELIAALEKYLRLYVFSKSETKNSLS
jgi:hypothetical protein